MSEYFIFCHVHWKSNSYIIYEIGTENISFISKRELQLDFKRHTSWSFDFMLKDLRWEVIVRFVDIDEMVDHHCLQFRLFSWYWFNRWPSLFKLSFVLLILMKCLTITVYSFVCFVDIGRIVDHHCLSFLLYCLYWWNCWPSLSKLSVHNQEMSLTFRIIL